MSFFISHNFFLFKVCFVYIVQPPLLFWLLLAWNIFLHSYPFSLFVFLDVKCVSCRLCIFGSCVFIHYVNHGVLIVEINPFTCKAIIDNVGLSFVISYLFSIHFIAFSPLFPALLFYFVLSYF